MTKKEQDRRYRAKNPEKMKEFHKRSYVKNREKRLKYKKEHYCKNKERYAICARLNYLRRKGIIKLNKCERCGTEKQLIMHHEDYNKPFEINVLCRSCHNKLHKLLD